MMMSLRVCGQHGYVRRRWTSRAWLFSRRCSNLGYVRTHYDVLGISPDSTDKQIKQAYLALSKQCHPDVQPHGSSSGGEQRRAERRRQQFLDINMAYQVLSKPHSRRMYDRSLQSSASPFRVLTDMPTIDDRIQAAGFKIDPDFYAKHVNANRIMLACVVVALVGFVSQIIFITFISSRHRKAMDQKSKFISAQYQQDLAQLQSPGGLDEFMAAALKPKVKGPNWSAGK